MGRFGFGKKDRDGDEDSNRLGLFGSRSKSKSPAPSTDNPYAKASVPLDPYTQAKMKAGLIPSPQGQQAANSLQNGHGTTQNPHQQHENQNVHREDRGGYGANRYGNDGGYGGGNAGGNPYGSTNNSFGAGRPGGYGGLGRTNTYGSADNAAEKDELFGGARDRVQQKQQYGNPPDYAYNGNGDQAESQSYGAYGDRQLTAEEEEEEDVQATKQEIKFTRKQDIASTQRSIAMMDEALERGGGTLARLGQQGERLLEAEMSLDLADGKMKVATDKTGELYKVNGSMFNPLNYTPNNKKNMERTAQKAVDRHQKERATREENRSRMFQANEKNKERFKQIGASNGEAPKQKLSQRANYLFEADSEDERDEDILDQNLDGIHTRATKFKYIAKAMGDEINEQNATIDRIGGKSDNVNENVVRQTARLKRIH